MATATLPPPPITTALAQSSGTPSQSWARWLQQLQSTVLGADWQVFTPYTASSPLVVPSDWTTVTSFSNAWIQMAGRETVAYRKDQNGTVSLKGEISTGTFFQNAFVLPTGFQPNYSHYASVYSNNGTTQVVGAVLVTATGGVQPIYGSSTEVSLANIIFPCSDRSPYIPSCFPFSVTLPASFAPTAVIAQCAATGSPTRFTAFPVDWSASGTTLTVNNIPGLLPSTSYIVTLMAN